MFHLWHRRYYKAYYNHENELGQQLIKAQNAHVDNEGFGVIVSIVQKESIVASFDLVTNFIMKEKNHFNS